MMTTVRNLLMITVMKYIRQQPFFPQWRHDIDKMLWGCLHPSFHCFLFPCVCVSLVCLSLLYLSLILNDYKYLSISLFPASFQSPECHRHVNLLCCSFDVILIIRQCLHFPYSFLDHVLPALHPIQVSFQWLVENFDRHEVVLHVACQPVAGGL